MSLVDFQPFVCIIHQMIVNPEPCYTSNGGERVQSADAQQTSIFAIKIGTVAHQNDALLSFICNPSKACFASG